MITTLGIATAIAGVLSWYTGGTSILSGIPDSLTSMGSNLWLGLPQPLYLLALVAIFNGAALVITVASSTILGRKRRF